jgi:hypothetical protein
MSNSDNLSVAPSILCGVSSDELKLIKREMKMISDERKLRQYVLEKSDLLHGIRTELLNSYHSVETHKLVCRRGVLHCVKNDTREKSLLAMRKDIDMLKAIISSIVELNQLKLPQ